MDGFLKANIDMIKNEAIPNNWDALSIMFGMEGSGKTTMAFQLASYVDESFNIDRVVFTPDQFEEAIDNCEPESAIVWDEAITGANISMYASKISLNIISKLTQIRKKKLMLFLCFPYLWMLNKYFLSRCLFTCYIHAKSFTDRGYFKFYSSQKSRVLYWFMKERFPYYPEAAIRKILPNFHGVFNKKFTIDAKKYDEKKESSRTEENNNAGDKTKNIMIKLTDKGMTQKEISNIMGISQARVSQVINQ